MANSAHAKGINVRHLGLVRALVLRSPVLPENDGKKKPLQVKETLSKGNTVFGKGRLAGTNAQLT